MLTLYAHLGAQESQLKVHSHLGAQESRQKEGLRKDHSGEEKISHQKLSSTTVRYNPLIPEVVLIIVCRNIALFKFNETVLQPCVSSGS